MSAEAWVVVCVLSVPTSGCVQEWCCTRVLALCRLLCDRGLISCLSLVFRDLVLFLHLSLNFHLLSDFGFSLSVDGKLIPCWVVLESTLVLPLLGACGTAEATVLPRMCAEAGRYLLLTFGADIQRNQVPCPSDVLRRMLNNTC